MRRLAVIGAAVFALGLVAVLVLHILFVMRAVELLTTTSRQMDSRAQAAFDRAEELRQAANDLRAENGLLRGRVQSFETMFGLLRYRNAPAGVGGSDDH